MVHGMRMTATNGFGRPRCDAGHQHILARVEHRLGDLQNQRIRFPLAVDGFTETAFRTRFQPQDSLAFIIGHRYLNNHPILTASSQLDLRATARLNSNWTVDLYHRWEFDDRTLQVQEYSVFRDLESWIAR